jgi:fatty acid desaturase
MKIIKNREDIRTLIFLFLIMITRLVFWWYSPKYFFIWLPFIVGLVFILYRIKHNQIHRSTFFSTKLNRLFEYFLSVFTGTSNQSVHIVHIINHHTEINNDKDWGNTNKFQHSLEIYNFINYIFYTPLNFIKEKRRWLKKNRENNVAKKNTIDSWYISLTYLVMIIINLESTIIYILVPNIAVQLVLVSFNYFQHRDCNPFSKYNHSRNFTGSLLNFLTFNNGFHSEHHLYPAAHWSEYKEIHNKINRHIDQNLNETNLLFCFFNLIITKRVKISAYGDN